LVTLMAFVGDPDAWSAERLALRRLFENEFSGAGAQRHEGEGYSDFRDQGWSIPDGDTVADVWLGRGGMGVSVSGSIECGARIFVWYRKVVPTSVDVRMSDEMYSFDRAISPDEEPDDLIQWYRQEVGE
jgi:hypothetical protein